MKLCLALLISLNLIHQIVSSNIVELDSSNLFGLFSKSDTFNIIRTDPLLLPIPTDKHKIISFKVFFEEQCAIKCLRNVHCIKYSYSSDQMCLIGLRDGFERRIEFYSDDADKITSLVNCDLNACSNGLYCSASSVTSNHGTCLCHPSDNGNACSAARDAYELSSWTEWTQCTANCDQLQGFKQRSKDCLRNNNATVNEMDWLCNGQDFSDQFEVESCSIDECLTYKEWSEWTSCSKICGGYMLRKRECFPGTEKSCNEKYLTEVKECSLKDCDNMLIALDQSELVSTNTDIIKRGYLKFQNVFTNQFVNIFSHSQDQTDINNIGHVVCQEFGFKKLDNANAIEAVDLRARFENDAEYDDFLKKKSITGIKCTGAEKTVKDCKTVHDSTDLFEIEIECSYDGYWTHWSSWSECSATCGAGAMTRSRSCQNPPPSISESDGENGLDCAAGKKLELTSCFKAKCEDNQIIF